MLAALAREARSCAHDKADRATLAALLTEMAMRLTNELTDPRRRGRWQWLIRGRAKRSARPAVTAAAARRNRVDDESFAELRSLIVGPEQRELLALHGASARSCASRRATSAASCRTRSLCAPTIRS